MGRYARQADLVIVNRLYSPAFEDVFFGYQEPEKLRYPEVTGKGPQARKLQQHEGQGLYNHRLCLT